MSEEGRICLVLSVQKDDLPSSIPTWVGQMVVAMSRAHDAHLAAEQSASVIAGSDDDIRTKAARCSNVLGVFVREQGATIQQMLCHFLAHRGEIPAGIAHGIGVQLSQLVMTHANLLFRQRMLREVASKTFADEAAVVVAQMMFEGSPGQQIALDWIRGTLLAEKPQTNPSA